MIHRNERYEESIGQTNQLTVKVRNVHGKTKKFQMQRSETILDLKQKVRTEFNVEVTMQNLMMWKNKKSTTILDSNTLEDVNDGQVFNLIVTFDEDQVRCVSFNYFSITVFLLEKLS